MPSILVVDDLPDNLRLLVAMLDVEGYTVRPVRDAKLALLSARSSPPDIILLDAIMPGMDGYELCRRLKTDERTRDIPVIFISAQSEITFRLKAFEAGGADYINKPVLQEELLLRVRTQLSLSHVSGESSLV